jgi:putative ABC transport system permease protein
MRGADPLYSRYARNDLIKNKGVNIALTAVLVLSAFLMATGSMVVERLVGSVDQLFEEAQPPHFLQMHQGGTDLEALERFAAERPEVDAWQIQEMVGFDSAAVSWSRPSTGESGDLSESLIDNLFVTQNEGFDFLLDGSGAIPRPAGGEVYVPVAYQQRFALRTGDELRVGTGTAVRELTVRGFVRDAQMASSLSSATRFVVSEADFAELERAGGATPEVIVGYRLSDPSAAAGFQRAYESDQALPRNGQAVTFQMIRMINAFSDGLVAVALVFVSLLLMAIALLSVRFVIRGTMEDEVREIGAMKAVGIPGRAVCGLYLAKYRLMSLFACVVGGALAVIATALLTRGVQTDYAEAPWSATTVLVPVIALALVHLFVIGACRGVLRGIGRIQVVGALVHGSTLDERRAGRRDRRRAGRMRRGGLASYRGTNLNRRLALLDLRAEGGRWALVPVVFFLAAVLMTLPANLLSTFESPRFVTYMGAPESDLRADLQFSDDVDRLRDDVLAAMRDDDRLTDPRVFANVLYEVRGEEGWETLRVEVGDYSGRTVEFLDGERPGPGQIALSVLNAERYGLSPGDELTLRGGAGPAAAREAVTVTVSGLYQDVTAGGYTAKLQGGESAGATAYVIHADTAGGADPSAVAAEYGERFPGAAVIPMREYVQQTLSHVTGAFQSAAVLAFVFGPGVAVLITSLFLKLRLARERSDMGVLSAIGFSTGEIIARVRTKTLLAVAAGTLLGVVFAATAGESLVGLLISTAGLGITDLAFLPNPWLVYAAYPLVLIGAGYLGAVFLTARLRGADKSSWLRQ